jgi:carbon storage regulator CsrA
VLILSRKVGEQVVVPEFGLSVKVVAVKGNTIRLAFAAPQDVDICRAEIWHPSRRRGGVSEVVREEVEG